MADPGALGFGMVSECADFGGRRFVDHGPLVQKEKRPPSGFFLLYSLFLEYQG
jgi:hypothetical protein